MQMIVTQHCIYKLMQVIVNQHYVLRFDAGDSNYNIMSYKLMQVIVNKHYVLQVDTGDSKSTLCLMS